MYVFVLWTIVCLHALFLFGLWPLYIYPFGISWSWSYDSWIYNYLCNQCLSPLTLYIWIPFRRVVLDTTLCDKVCQWLATGRWFSPVTPVSSTNKTDRHDITEILLKVALNTKPNPKPSIFNYGCHLGHSMIAMFEIIWCCGFSFNHIQ